MRVTAPYAPIMQPWGGELTFDEVTAGLRFTQLRLERYMQEHKHKHTDKCYHPWFGEPEAWDKKDSSCRFLAQMVETHSYVSNQIAQCAKSFKRLPEAVPSQDGLEGQQAPLPKSINRNQE